MWKGKSECAVHPERVNMHNIGMHVTDHPAKPDDGTWHSLHRAGADRRGDSQLCTGELRPRLPAGHDDAIPDAAKHGVPALDMHGTGRAKHRDGQTAVIGHRPPPAQTTLCLQPPATGNRDDSNRISSE